MERTECDTLG